MESPRKLPLGRSSALPLSYTALSAGFAAVLLLATTAAGEEEQEGRVDESSPANSQSEVSMAALPAVGTAGYDGQVIERARAGGASHRLQLLETYEELYNWTMTDALAKLILEQDGADNVPALHAVADAHLRNKNGAAALKVAVRLVDLDPTPDAQALKARALAITGRHREAAEILEKIKADSGGKSPFLWQESLAFAWFHAGEKSKSTKAFKEIITETRYDSKVQAAARKQLRLMRALEAQQLMRTGENDKAVAILRGLQKDSGPTFEYQEDLGHALQHAGQLNEARRTFAAIVQGSGYSTLQKSNARDQVNLIDSVEAEDLKEQGDYERAISLLTRMKKKFRNSVFPFQDQLAYALADSGDSDAAREAFQEIATNRGYPSGQRKTAREEIQEIDVNTLLEKGYAALEGRVNWKRARQIEAILTNRYPSHPDAIGYHASILSLSGRCGEAVEILERLKSSRFAGKSFPLAGILAECYYQVGRF